MSHASEEDLRPLDRRRYPRHHTPADLELSIPIVSQGEVLDLSETGALISTPVRLQPGDRARLSLVVGREPFSASVRVVRSEEGTRVGRLTKYHLGLAFTSLDEPGRQVIQRFVRREPPRTV